MTEELVVALGGRVAGRISRLGPSSAPVFNYDPDYLTTAVIPLSIRLPLGSDTFRAERVTPFLEGLVPENEQTRQRWASRLRVDRTDTFSLLATMGWDCPGAVQFARPEDLEVMLARDQRLEPASAAEIGDRLRVLRGDPAAWSLPDEHWSLPGQQEKLALARRAGQWFSAKGAAATTHIIKPGIGRLHHQALVEYATMRAARDVGVDVATVEFTHFDGEPAIVIERFDRIEVDGEVLRVHQEDFCQALGVLPARKYEEHNGPGLARLADVITRNSNDPDTDRWALARFAAINYVAGAPDGHAKNISLALWPGDVHVAPLYDLATSFPYDERTPADRKVAVSIGGRREFGKVYGKHWDRAAQTLRLDPEQYREEVRMMAAGFPASFDGVLSALDHPAAAEVRARAVPRLQKHVDHLLGGLDGRTRSQ